MEIVQRSGETLVIELKYRTLISTIFAAALVGIIAYFCWVGYTAAPEYPGSQILILFVILAVIILPLLYLTYLCLGQTINKLTLDGTTQTLTVNMSNIFTSTEKKYPFSAVKGLEWQWIKRVNMLCLKIDGKNLELFGLNNETKADHRMLAAYKLKKIGVSIAAFNEFLETHKGSKRN